MSEWMRGGGGVRLPRLDLALPFLPPFVSSLSTLTALLKCKTELEERALPLLSSSGDAQRRGAAEEGVRRLVAEQLGANPAYLLLKARFLSCFSLPAFLATVHPQESEDSDEDSALLTPFTAGEEEETTSTAEDGDSLGEGLPKVNLPFFS